MERRKSPHPDRVTGEIMERGERWPEPALLAVQAWRRDQRPGRHRCGTLYREVIQMQRPDKYILRTIVQTPPFGTLAKIACCGLWTHTACDTGRLAWGYIIVVVAVRHCVGVGCLVFVLD